MIVVTGDQRVDVELINNVVSYLEKAKKVYSSPKKKINTLEQNELDGYRLDSHYTRTKNITYNLISPMYHVVGYAG